MVLPHPSELFGNQPSKIRSHSPKTFCDNKVKAPSFTARGFSILVLKDISYGQLVFLTQLFGVVSSSEVVAEDNPK